MTTIPELTPLPEWVFDLRIQVARVLSRKGLLNEGRLPDGSVVPDFVDSSGVDVDSIANICGPEVAKSVEDSLTSEFNENSHWSRRTEKAKERHTGGYWRPKDIRRGPGRHSDNLL